MKFTCEKAVLNEAISICIHAVATKSTIAVLEGLLITAEDELTLCGYNFKTGIKKTFPAEISEKGSIVLNAKIFSDIVRKLPDDIVEIVCDDHYMTTIRCGLSEFNLIGASQCRKKPRHQTVLQTAAQHDRPHCFRRVRQRKQTHPHRLPL